MDGLVEGVDVCEGLVGEVMGVKIAPDRLDFIEFGGVFRQPLDGEPVWWRRLIESDSAWVMSKTFRPRTIDQPLLLPARVQDFVDEAPWLGLFWRLCSIILTFGRSREATGASAGSRRLIPR